jgi:hypothetical protein
VSRLHARTPANRIRSQHSMFYRGFEISYHPDSWEFSFEPGLDHDRVFLGAQFSIRNAIDRLLAPADGPSSSAGHVQRPRSPVIKAAGDGRTLTHSRLARLLDAKELEAKPVLLPASGKPVSVSTFRRVLAPWTGELPTGFGSVPQKAAIEVEGSATYPELAVVAHLLTQGWNARWRKNFGGAAWWIGLGSEKELTAPADYVFDKVQDVARALAARLQWDWRDAGVWDVLAWRGRKFVFIELKGRTEGMKDNQRLWLEAALGVGVPLSSFAILRYR